MPRNGSGTFTLVSGNPVVTGTTIESNWANTTLSDIATAMTDSLSRSGQGGMTAALRIADGTQGAPGVGFASETGTGFYRAGTGEAWAVVQGSQTMKLDSTGVTVPAAKATSIEGTFVFNETGADKDARFEGDTDANLLFTDASTDRVGVGTATPAVKLDVNGAVSIPLSNNLTWGGAYGAGTPAISGTTNGLQFYPAGSTSNESVRFDASGNVGVGATTPTFGSGSGIEIERAGIATLRLENSTASNSFELYADSAGNGINLRGRDSSPMNFWTGNTLRATIDASGVLSLTQNPVLSAGTAFGVTYLDGSKVLTSGSALTFDGTNFTTTGYAAGNGLRSLGGNAVRFYNATNANWSQISAPAGTGDMQFDTGAGEQMRLTSTGLGIGTSSPATKLHVNTVAAGYGITVAASTQTSITYQLGIDSNSNLAFYDTNAAAQRLVLSNSGNLGLGVTPSAWTLGKAFEIGALGTAVWNVDNNNVVYTQNAYYQGGWKYARSAVASCFDQNVGSHRWFTSTDPTPTAGNAISFTQALTLDANRNLLLNGTAAPASGVGTFAIFNGTAPTGSVTDGCVLYTEDVSSSSELKVRDEAGNVTTLSPHNFELIPEGPSEDMAWSYYSERDGKRINVDMLKAIRLLEKLSGEQLVYEA